MQVSIIGSGAMGSGIAQVAATAGNEVKIHDTNPSALEKSRAGLDKILNRLVEKGRMDGDKKNSILSNITYVDSLKALSGSDLCIEAIIEDADIKKEVFSKLEKHQKSDTVIASNTSSLSIASLASALQKPGRFIGIHFFNPAPLMPLVEVIPAVQTSETVCGDVVKLISDWGKMVVQARDTPGFIVNRVARPFYGEALRIYEEGMAGVADIDRAMKELGGFRMGPFELMDFIGNDVNYTVTETVFNAFFQDPRYRPSFTQKRLSEAGFLGRKSGRGYYRYHSNGKMITERSTADDSLLRQIFERVLVMLINEAADALYYNIAGAKDIDLAMTKGVNYPKGLLAWANEVGIARCVEQMDALYDLYREDRYRCSPLLRKMAVDNRTFEV